jgi:hypothetical protein
MIRARLLIGLLASGCAPARVTGCPAPANSQLFVVTAGDLFAFDAGSDGAATPLRRVGTAGFAGPIAVDTTSHELFAVRDTTIEVHDSIAGDTAPLRTMTGLPPPGSIVGLVVDPPHRALFVVTSGAVTVLSEDGNGDISPIGQVAGATRAVAVDPSNEEVIVATGSEIDVYARDRLSSPPTRVLRNVPTGYGDSLNAFGLAVDTQRDELYAAVELPGGAHQLDLFDGAARGAAPTRTVATLDLTGAMAVDCARGEVFVGIQNGVNVLRADGSLQQIRQLQLPANPAGLALGP